MSIPVHLLLRKTIWVLTSEPIVLLLIIWQQIILNPFCDFKRPSELFSIQLIKFNGPHILCFSVDIQIQWFVIIIQLVQYLSILHIHKLLVFILPSSFSHFDQEQESFFAAISFHHPHLIQYVSTCFFSSFWSWRQLVLTHDTYPSGTRTTSYYLKFYVIL